MLDDVARRDQIETGIGERSIAQLALKDVETGLVAGLHGKGVELDAARLPTKLLHRQQVLAATATDVEQLAVAHVGHGITVGHAAERAREPTGQAAVEV